MDSPIISAKSRETHDFSPGQENLWVFHHFTHLKNAFNQVFAIRMEGNLDPEILQEALLAVVKEKQGLRTVFSLENGTPKPFILPAEEISFELDYVDLQNSTEQDKEVEDLIKKEQRFVFDLATFSLFRLSLVRLASTHYLAIFNFHKIIFDQNSRIIFLNTLFEGYANKLQLEVKNKLQWEFQHEGFDEAEKYILNQKPMLEQEKYWLAQFEDPLAEFMWRPDSNKEKENLTEGADISCVLSSVQSDKLRELANQHDLSIFDLLYAIYVVFLSKLGNTNEVLVGIKAPSRIHTKTSSSIGFWENNLAIINRVSPQMSFLKCVRELKENVFEAYTHQEYPLGELMRSLGKYA